MKTLLKKENITHNIQNGVDALISSGINENNINKVSNKNQLKKGKNIIRTTILVESEILEKIKKIAYYERTTMTEIINFALNQVVNNKWNKEIETFFNK